MLSNRSPLSIEVKKVRGHGRLPPDVPRWLPMIDGLLAATALVHNLTLVTRNAKEVERTGVKLVDPFDSDA